jgi:hypothetical protein
MRDATPEGRGDGLGPTALLRISLVQGSHGTEASWKENLILALLEQAEQGKGRAMQEIWSRVEGRPGAPERSSPPLIDEATARKILEAVRDDDDDPPTD